MAFRFLFRSPPPGLLAVSLVPGRIDFAHVDRTGARPRVLRAGSLPDGDGGLRRLRANLRRDGVRCLHLLRPDECQWLQTDAPAVPPEELAAAVRWRIKDLLEGPPDAATVDVLPVPAPARQLYAVAARNDLVGARMERFREAGLALAVIDVPETAQRNLAALVEPAGRGVALLAFHGAVGILTFSAGGELYYARRIERGGAQADDERIALEVQRSLDYFERQFGPVALAKLVVAGPAPGLPELLARDLHLPVERLDLAQQLDFSEIPELADAESQARLLPVLGAALREEA